jgi:predicted nucleic acid-binding protein
MNGIIHLDSDVAIEQLRGRIRLKVLLGGNNEVAISSFVLAELLVGARRSANEAAMLRTVERFVSGCLLVYPDRKSCEIYSLIRELEAKGRPIPVHDTWIAALSIQHNCSLFTYDAHYREVKGIRLFQP